MTDLPLETATEASGEDLASRRPLKSRGNPLAKRLAAFLAAREVEPNQISIASVAFAVIGLIFFLGASLSRMPGEGVLLILAALMIQARLLCNLLDGMVAIEGGMKSATGPYWNEAPDRIADILFFWGAGIAAGSPALGLGCGALSVATAWLRDFGRAEGFPADYSGPMAKQHRMAALTLGCLLAALLPITTSAATILTIVLWLILAGIALTLFRRTKTLIGRLENRG